MVLNEQVCADCNFQLGRDLDEILARDTYEASLRAERLPVWRRKKDRFKARRITMRVPDEPEFADFRGARMTIDWQTRKAKPADQIVVRDETGHLHSFTLDDVMSADEALFRNRPPGSVHVIGTSPSAATQLQRAAESKGVRFTSEPTEIDPPPASQQPSFVLEVQGLIDDAVWRAIAKIAFNYLAKIRGSGYVLDNRFDRIRDFVLGRQRDRALVRLTRTPILADETPYWKTHEMHLVLFERKGHSLQGRVSLFNSFTYEVMLCADLGLIYPIRRGHAFDPIEKSVYELTGVSQSLKIRPQRPLLVHPY